MSKPRFYTLLAMIFSAAAMRIIPHPWNFTPVAAMALFGGAMFEDKKRAFFVPFVALFLSDLILGFHPTMLVVYAALAMIVLLGRRLQSRVSMFSVIHTSLTSSLLFFFVTNGGVWLLTSLYPKTLQGLGLCFTMAIPFFHWTMMGDLFYCALLFGAFALAQKRFPVLRKSALIV